MKGDIEVEYANMVCAEARLRVHVHIYSKKYACMLILSGNRRHESHSACEQNACEDLAGCDYLTKHS